MTLKIFKVLNRLIGNWTFMGIDRLFQRCLLAYIHREEARLYE